MANKEQLLGKWNELKGKVKQTWGKLTDDDIAQINGRRQELLGKLQGRYGYAKERAEEELARFEKANCPPEREHATAGQTSGSRNRPNPRENESRNFSSRNDQ